MRVHLEDGLFRLCGELIQNDIEFQKTAVNRNFSKVDNNLFREYRNHRFVNIINYAFNNSKFYKNLFDKNNININDIKSISDIEKLPFTNPEDITGNSYDFLCLSQGEVEKPVTFYSGGTTGLQKRIYFSMNDIKNIMKFLSVGMNTIIGMGGTVQVILQNSQGRGTGAILAQSLTNMGMNAYATDVMSESLEQIKLTIDNKPDVWFGDSRVIYRITKEMEHKVDLSTLGVKTLFLTVHHTSPVMIDYLKKVWNCEISTHYGLTEMGWGLAVDCDSKSGFHYNELGVIIEVINPITGKVLTDGSEGELVYTSIGYEAMPLIRYRSRDISSISNEKCICGHDVQTLGYVHKRLESIIVLSDGSEIYPTMFDDILFSFEEVVDYNIYIDKSGSSINLIFDVEVLNKYEELDSNIANAINSIPAISENMKKPKVQLLPFGSLKKFINQKKLIREKENVI